MSFSLLPLFILPLSLISLPHLGFSPFFTAGFTASPRWQDDEEERRGKTTAGLCSLSLSHIGFPWRHQHNLLLLLLRHHRRSRHLQLPPLLLCHGLLPRLSSRARAARLPHDGWCRPHSTLRHRSATSGGHVRRGLLAVVVPRWPSFFSVSGRRLFLGALCVAPIRRRRHHRRCHARQSRSLEV